MVGYGKAAELLTGIFGARGLKAEEKLAVQAAEDAKKVKAPLLGGVIGGTSAAVSGIGIAGTAIAGGLAVREAYENFNDLKKMAGFFKFLVECLSDPEHMGKHFNEWMTGKSEEASGVNGLALGGALADRQDKLPAGAGMDEVSGVGVARIVGIVSTRPGDPKKIDVPIEGGVLPIKDRAGMSQRHDIGDGVEGSLAKAYGEAFKKDGELGKVYEVRSVAANGSEFVEHLVALDKDRFILAKDGLGAGFGVAPFEGADGREKLEGLRKSLSRGDIDVAASSLGRVYDVHDKIAAGSSVRFGAAMNGEDLSRLNAAMAPLGNFGVSSRETGWLRKGSDSQTRAEFISVDGQPRLEFAGERGRSLSIGGLNGEMISFSAKEGNFTRTAFVSGAEGIGLDKSGKLSVSEHGGQVLGAAGRLAGHASRLESEATRSGVTAAESTAVLDGHGHVSGQLMSFKSKEGREGAIFVRNGQALLVGEDGKMHTVKDDALKVDEKTGAIHLGKSAEIVESFFKFPNARAVGGKDEAVGIGSSPAAFLDRLKRGERVMVEGPTTGGMNSAAIWPASRKEEGQSR